MAEIADVKIGVTTDADAKALLNYFKGKGTPVGIQTGFDKAGTATGNIVTARGVTNPAAAMADIKAMNLQSMRGAVTSTKEQESSNFWTRIAQKFDRNAGLGKLNQRLFMLQMSSLGVAFSFQSVINSAAGMFQGLSDLGSLISGFALGSAFSGMATGGAGTDMASVFGISTEDMTAAWAGFTAIVIQIQSLVNGLAVKVLSPEMVKAILDVVNALAVELAKPAVIEAIQAIMFAILDTVKALIPLTPTLAEVVKAIAPFIVPLMVLIIIFSEILLPLLSLVEMLYAFIVVLATVAPYITMLAEIIGGTLIGTILLWTAAIAGILIVGDFFYNLIINLMNGMDLVSASAMALGQVWTDITNIVNSVISTIGGLFGLGGKSSTPTTTASNVTNNYNFNRSVGSQAQKDVSKNMQNISNSSYTR